MNANSKGGKYNKPGRTKAFVAHYLKTFNATASALAAGYSQRTSYSIGPQLLKRPDVIAALKAFRDKVDKEAILSFEERARILSEIARAQVQDFVTFNEGGTVTLKLNAEQKNRISLKRIKQRVESEDAGGGLITDLELKDTIAAIRELNEMFGDHAPKRIDARVSGLESMTDEELTAEHERLKNLGDRIAAGKAKVGNACPD
jgi:hypothetical protein